MVKGLLKKFYALLKKEAVHENEPQRILFLLRNMLLFLTLYFLIFPAVMCLVGPRTEVWVALVFAVLSLGAFYGTYRVRVQTSVLICVTLQLAWVIAFVLMYGWDCGIQHLMFEMIVLLYFSIYNALIYKIGYTVFLFIVRFCLFMYCRSHVPYFPLSETATVVIQVVNMVLAFLLIGIACGAFSSNVESAEKKLVLYNEQLKKQAGTDPLTGLWNRRQMMQYITEKHKKDPKMAFTLGMGDIDFFKRINDHWGHDCGDAVLVWITKHMSRELSEHAKLCRWGGEEFIFFFPDMNGDEVCTILNVLRMKLDNDPFDWKGEWIPVTMTFGVEENDFHSNIDTLLKNVDDKLYMGKEQGRDRVIY
ncbi:MAG: GGDEF domain-containing protein [Clostridia bacterium]|nr:GGDEF domain-containing protein [Clostridia bacterium]